MAERKPIGEELEELRAAVREAHEAIKDMRLLERRLTSLKVEVEEAAGKVFDERIESQVAAGLEGYQAAIVKAIDDATEATYRRFDKIGDILLGEDRSQRGEPSLMELARRRASKPPERSDPA